MGLRIESFAVINLRGVSTNKTIIDIRLVGTTCCESVGLINLVAR